MYGEVRNSYCKILVAKPEGKIPLRIYWHRCKVSTKTDHVGIRCVVVDWIQLFQRRVQWQDLACRNRRGIL
jgi:hypothetical protein